MMFFLFFNTAATLLCKPDPKAIAISQPRQLSNTQIAELLGWKVSTDPKNLCHGYYAEPLLLFPELDQNSRVKADEGSLYPRGCSELRGNVTVQQPSKQVQADIVYLYHDPKIQKIKQIDLYGHVRVREPGRLLLGDTAHLEVQENTGIINNSIYRLALSDKQSQIHGIVELQGTNAWGRASRLEELNKTLYRGYEVTYATCPPTRNSWQLSAKQIDFDNAKHIAYAHHVIMRVKNIPVLYTPYLHFSLDNQRKTGFLMPWASYSTRSGYQVNTPFYLNLASNFDATISPIYISERGIMLANEFRWLAPTGYSVVNGSFIPQDKKFKHFLQDHPSITASSNRRYFSTKSHQQFNAYWSGNLDFNYVSDDYFFQDFTHSVETTTANQLIREADVHYDTEHWHFLARVQGFQTLNPIDQAPVSQVYRELPQLQLQADYPHAIAGGNLNVESEFIYFDWPSVPNVITPSGYRVVINPHLSFPYSTSTGFITPSVSLDFTHYDLHRPSFIDQTDRVLPTFSVDTGLIFERNMTWSRDEYIQTLEPRIFYLYVPFKNQDLLPLFDTGIYQFDYPQLFRTNRFSGHDRIGDANQLTLGISTRFIDANSGEERLYLGMGDIIYFRNRDVGFCTGMNCQPIQYIDSTDNFSPLAGIATYYFNSTLSTTGMIAWDFLHQEVNNGNLNLHYQPNNREIINLGYSYARHILALESNQVLDRNRLHQVYASTVLPVSQSWSLLGIWSYNIAEKHTDTYFFGGEYDSCCWAVRLLAGRTLNAVGVSGKPQYDMSYHIQLLLKGLGTVAANDPSQILRNNVIGYRDWFHKE